MSQDLPTPRYRVYTLDGVSRILNAEWVDAHSDEEAIAIVQETCGGVQCELWDGDRLVAKIQATRLTA